MMLGCCGIFPAIIIGVCRHKLGRKIEVACTDVLVLRGSSGTGRNRFVYLDGSIEYYMVDSLG